MKNSQKLLKAISAFTLTSVLLILVYYIGAIYPFGDHALFKWDMELQYIDFFHWWHRVLHGQASMRSTLLRAALKQRQTLLKTYAGFQNLVRQFHSFH